MQKQCRSESFQGPHSSWLKPGQIYILLFFSAFLLTGPLKVTAQTIAGKVEIPARVYTVLSFVKANHEAPPGFVGGRRFGNFEGLLPAVDSTGTKIAYQEWDVNEHVRGVNRGAERLITGSNGKAWYTPDHYQTFLEVKDGK